MIVWVLIVLVVFAVLVFITINMKKENKMPENNNVVALAGGAKAGDMVTVNYTGKLARAIHNA